MAEDMGKSGSANSVAALIDRFTRWDYKV